jgi:trehalose 6-phosphate phosphatase
MKHLFAPDGRQAIAAVMRLRPLLAFDFDGTLAPIVLRPDDARVAAPVARALARLGSTHPIAIVTGRRVADVVARLGFEPAFIVGSHGAEGLSGEPLADFEAALTDVRRRLADHAAALGHAGVLIEDKGSSIALHYRIAADPVLALQSIDAALADVGPDVRIFGGKFVVNAVAAAAPDKGVAMLRLVERASAGAALFVGDDVNDEAVFEIAPPHWLTVRVGRVDTGTRARYYLDSHHDMARLMQQLIDPHRIDAAEPPT